jgi:LAS superfamily LD-carboxypeptidase LdcB
MDETGIQLSVLKSMKVLRGVDEQQSYRGTPTERELVTAVECIAMDGFVLKPMIIMKGKAHRNAWYSHDGTIGWHFAVSKNGYTDYGLSYEWLKLVFEPQTRSRANGQARILISDGLMAHETVDCMEFCFAHNIICMRLPSHTSHLTQPLDVSCFGPLKAYYRAEVEKLFRGGAGTINKRHFTWLYDTARTKAFTKCNIQSGWTKTGLYPFNPELVLEKERLASAITVRHQSPTSSTPQPHHQDTSTTANLPPDTTPLQLRTPSTTRQLDDLSQSLHASLEKNHMVDTPCRTRVTKLIHAAQHSFTERSLLMDENRTLFQQNCEKATRQSHGMSIVGSARVVSHDDLLHAREQRNKPKPQPRQRKKTTPGVEEDTTNLELDVEEPWMRYAGVIQF